MRSIIVYAKTLRAAIDHALTAVVALAQTFAAAPLLSELAKDPNAATDLANAPLVSAAFQNPQVVQQLGQQAT